jgi:phosphatidylserine synthase
MNFKKIISVIITILLLIGIWGAGGLVWEEIKTGNGCPKIWIIPACVIILVCFLIPFVSHILKKWNKLYFVFTGTALIIAIIASIMQVTGKGECPKIDNGIPMCYLSFLIFSVLIILKLIEQNTKIKH